MAEDTCQPCICGVARERELARNGVLVHPNARDAVPCRDTERQRTVTVVDDRNRAVDQFGASLGHGVEHQPIRRIDGEQIRGLGIGIAAYSTKDGFCIEHGVSVAPRQIAFQTR